LTLHDFDTIVPLMMRQLHPPKAGLRIGLFYFPQTCFGGFFYAARIWSYQVAAAFLFEIFYVHHSYIP